MLASLSCGNSFSICGLNERGDVAREPCAVVFAAAEQQAVIVGQSEVIDDEPRIVNPEAAGNDTEGAFPAERFCRKHEIVNRHDPARHSRFQLAEIAVAGKHGERGFDLAL